ncbi:ABC transporter permease, partial [Streptomyces sp. NPDC006386]
SVLQDEDRLVTGAAGGLFVWGSAQRGTPVQINVIGTAMFVVAVLFVLVSMAVGNRRNRQKA